MSYKQKADEIVQQKQKQKDDRQKISSVRIQEMINEMEESETKWSTWEQGFVNNIQKRMDDEEFITDGQCDKLQEVYDKYVEGNSTSRRQKDRPRYNI